MKYKEIENQYTDKFQNYAKWERNISMIFFLYHDTQFFETGPRLSTMSEISTIKNTSWLSILSNENLTPKQISEIKVFSHFNKGSGSIFHLSHCLQKNICNVWHVEISAFFINFSQKLHVPRQKCLKLYTSWKDSKFQNFLEIV